MSFEHICVAVDFSDTSREALRAAARLARNARLTLVYVWHAQHPYGSFSGDDGNAVVDEGHELKMREWIAEATAHGASNVDATFLTGDPADAIVEHVRADASIDLVVAGTHGRTGLAHIFLGSVAEKIVRRSPCAVMVIPTASRGRAPVGEAPA